MLVEIVEVLGIDKAEATLYFRVKALAELVKYVEAPFMRVLHDYTRLFQKKIADLPSDRLACREADLDVLALKESFHKCQLMSYEGLLHSLTHKSGRVVVSDSFGVTKCL